MVERCTYHWMRSSDHYVPLVSSMGFLILFENLVLVQWGSDLQRVVLPFADLNLRFASLVVSIPQLSSLVLAIGLVICLRMLLQKTQTGRGLRAIAESPSTAEILGVVVTRMVPMVFVIGGLFAALGGMLFALNYQQVHPFMGEEVALKAYRPWSSAAWATSGAPCSGAAHRRGGGPVHPFFNADFVDFSVYGLLLVILFFKPTRPARRLRDRAGEVLT